MWRWIPMFEHRYKITRLGDVIFVNKDGVESVRSLVPDKNGYLTVNLKIGSKVYCKKPHRLVAEAFIDGDCSLTVNHINGIKTDNNVENLEWLSNKDNLAHSRDTGLKPVHKKYSNNTTGYYGVSVDKGRYVAAIRRSGKRYYYGSYGTAEEASVAIKEAIQNELKQ